MKKSINSVHNKKFNKIIYFVLLPLIGCLQSPEVKTRRPDDFTLATATRDKWGFDKIFNSKETIKNLHFIYGESSISDIKTTDSIETIKIMIQNSFGPSFIYRLNHNPYKNITTETIKSSKHDRFDAIAHVEKGSISFDTYWSVVDEGYWSAFKSNLESIKKNSPPNEDLDGVSVFVEIYYDQNYKSFYFDDNSRTLTTLIDSLKSLRLKF
jgi:hypothetical protein